MFPRKKNKQNPNPDKQHKEYVIATLYSVASELLASLVPLKG